MSKSTVKILVAIGILVIIAFFLWSAISLYLEGVDNIKSEDPKENPTQEQKNFITERDKYCKSNPGKCKGYGK